MELADASPLLRLPATHIAPDRLGKPYRDLKGKISRTTHTPGSRIGIYRLLYIVHTFSCRSLHRTHSSHSPDWGLHCVPLLRKHQPLFRGNTRPTTSLWESAPNASHLGFELRPVSRHGFWYDLVGNYMAFAVWGLYSLTYLGFLLVHGGIDCVCVGKSPCATRKIPVIRMAG